MRRPNLVLFRAPGSHRRLRTLAALLLTVPLLVGMLGTPAATGDDLSDALAQQKALQARIATQKQQVARLNAQQAALSERIASTSQTLDGINANLTVVKGQVATIVADVALVQASYRDLANQLATINLRLKALENDEARRQLALTGRRALLAERVRMAYAESQTSLLETMLSAQSFTDVLSDVGYYLDFGAQDKALADQIVADIRAVAAIHEAVLGVRADTLELRGLVAQQKTQLDSELARLKAAQAKLKSLQDSAKAQLANERGSYSKLAQNKTHLAAAIRKATAAKAALKKKIDRLAAEQRRAGSIPSIYNGSLSWPMAGSVSQEFGCTGVVYEPSVGNCRHFHQGIDVVAPYGTPIRSSGPGIVLYIGWNYADGYDPAWIVIVAHSENLQTWYAHMEPANPGGIVAGSPISSGQVVGFEGNTGHSTGAHLHWAVRLNGEFVNPRLFL